MNWDPMQYAAAAFFLLVLALISLLVIRRMLVGRFYRWRFQKSSQWGTILDRIIARMDEPRPAELEEISFAGHLTRGLLMEVLMKRMDLMVGNSRLPLIKVFRQTGLQKLSLVELKSSDVWTRRHAADNLGRAGGREVSRQLILALADPDEDTRAIAARSLGRLGIQVAAPHMVTLFPGLSEDFCLVMSNSLVDLGPSALLPLSRGLSHRDEKSRYFSALSVSRICEEGRCRREVMKVLPTRRATDVEAVYPIKLNERLRRLTRDRSPRVRRAAIEAQASTLDMGALPAIEKMLVSDPVPEVRAAAAKALGQLESYSSTAALMQALIDPSWQVAYSASRALVELAPPGLSEAFDKASVRATRAGEWREEVLELIAEAGA